MNIDFFTTTALADEFRLKIMGGRVQKITQVTPLAFGLELYMYRQRHYLYLDAEPQAPCAYIQSYKPRRGEGNEVPLLQLFRKYLDKSVLMTIEHPPYERVLLFHFDGPQGVVTIVIEMLGTRSNLLCLDETGRILSLARPTSSQARRRRVLLPNHPYTPPVPQPNKHLPETLTPPLLQGLCEQLGNKNRLSKALLKFLVGLSPLIAREIVYRATSNLDITVGDVTDWETVTQTISLVYAHVAEHSWLPHALFTQNHAVEFFAPLTLTHLPNAEPVNSMCEAVEAHFSRRQQLSLDGYFAARLPIQQRLEKARTRLTQRLAKLEKDLAAVDDPQALKEKGEAILAYSYQIKPRQTHLEVPWTGEDPLTITLDPERSPPENAQRYFKRYQKAKRAAQIIPRQCQEIKNQIDYVDQLSLDLELAESRPEIDVVALALRQLRLTKGSQKKHTKRHTKAAVAGPRQYTSPDGFLVLVGRNAQQNHNLTFGRANSDDIWLHARGVPGAHVIITTAEGDPPLSTIEWAAGLAATYSKARNERYVEVSYTPKKHVRPIKGAPPGLVTLRNEKTVRVQPLSIVD